MLQGWFDAMRTEYYKYNINVTMVCPGPVSTDGDKAAFGSSVDQVCVGFHNSSIKENGFSLYLQTWSCFI